MISIDSSGYPLVFKMVEGALSPDHQSIATGETAVRVYGRALQGMQKEAVVLVSTDSGSHSWRMVCDEGPYLNGTDLAPFPLALYTARMQFSLLSELIRSMGRMLILVPAAVLKPL